MAGPAAAGSCMQAGRLVWGARGARGGWAVWGRCTISGMGASKARAPLTWCGCTTGQGVADVAGVHHRPGSVSVGGQGRVPAGRQLLVWRARGGGTRLHQGHRHTASHGQHGGGHHHRVLAGRQLLVWGARGGGARLHQGHWRHASHGQHGGGHHGVLAGDRHAAPEV